MYYTTIRTQNISNVSSDIDSIDTNLIPLIKQPKHRKNIKIVHIDILLSLSIAQNN